MKTNVKRSLRVGGAAAVGLLLAGCSATHVGESWQCPLAQGSSCATIAEADPAVPAAVRTAALFGDPLLEARRGPDGMAAAGRRHQREACAGDCGPLAWLKGLFKGDTGNDPAALPPNSPATAAAAEPAPPGSANTADASLRVPEVLGRVWIAPFVDADGIYREAHWVRVVLEPAGWKLP